MSVKSQCVVSFLDAIIGCLNQAVTAEGAEDCAEAAEK